MGRPILAWGPPWGRLLGGLDALQSAFLQTKLTMRADAHEFQTGGIRLSVDENQVGLEMTIAKIAPRA